MENSLLNTADRNIKKRYDNIDLLKFIAIFMVITLHVPLYFTDFIKTQNITNVDAEVFCNYYESNGWRIGRNAMKNWQMAVKGWATRNAKTGQQQSQALKGNKNNYTL